MLTLDHLLADSCSNPDVAFDPNVDYQEFVDSAEGWNRYVIELHCITYTISAKKVTDGHYDQENCSWIIPPHFDIRSVVKS